MRSHYLQHVPFEGLGSIEAWLQKANYQISSTQLFDSDELPEINDIDLLIVMGGPMSVNDQQKHPWLVNEKAFIRRVIEAGKPVLGICLGAQLIANALGAKVSPNPVKEIGWYPVETVASESDSIFRFPEALRVFHWHGENFSLPKGAVRIAKSKACENQAFQIGANVMGLQFHLETTPQSARSLVENCRDELLEGEYINSEKEILSAPLEWYVSINSVMARVLEYLHTGAVRDQK